MKIYVAIDDTDNLESKGTGFRARELASILQQCNFGQILGITRHQLFVHAEIPFTSHNSAACIIMESSVEKMDSIIELSADYLIKNAAAGSDAGLCVCSENKLNDELMHWGKRAKSEVLTMDMAYLLAKKYNIFLKGYTGTCQGIIGAIAAVGLYATGNDGRYLWVKGMREILGTYPANELLKITGIELITTLDKKNLFTFEKITLTEWWRPVLKNTKAVLYVESINNTENEYRVIPKDIIKSISC